MAQSQVRTYSINARSTDTFGRVLCNTRNHHFIVDGPEQNGCPGEAVNPGEIFLAGVAACGVELVQVIAKSEGTTPRSIAVEINGSMDRGNPVRQDLSVFNSVRLHFTLEGVTQAQADDLIGRFRQR